MTHSSADGKNTEKNAAKSCLRSRLDHAIETVEKKYGISYVPQGALTLSDFSDVGAHLFRIPQAQACSRDELGSLVEDIRNICGTVVDGRRKKRDEFNKLKTLTQVCVMRRMGAVPFSDEGRLADDFIQKCADKLESGEILRPDDDSFSRNIRWTHFLVHEYLDNDGIFECFNPPTVQAKEARKRKAGKGTNEAPVAHLTPGGLKCLQAAFADLAAERLEDVERFLADMDLSTGGAVLDKLPQAVEHFLKTAGPDTFGGDYQAGPPVHEMHLQVEEDRRAVIVALEDAFNALEIALSLRAYESRPPEKKKNRDTGEFDPYAVGDISVPDNDATNRKSDELHTGILRHYPLWRGHYMADKLVKKWCPKEELRSLANWQNTQARHNSDRREVLFRRAVTAAAIDIWQQDVNVPLGEVAERVAEFFEKDEGRGVDASFGRFLREYSAKFQADSDSTQVTPIGPGVPSRRSHSSKLPAGRKISVICVNFSIDPTRTAHTCNQMVAHSAATC